MWCAVLPSRWAPRTHVLYPTGTRGAVAAVMAAVHRLLCAQGEGHGGSGGGGAAGLAWSCPPIEVWLGCIMPFVCCNPQPTGAPAWDKGPLGVLY